MQQKKLMLLKVNKAAKSYGYHKVFSGLSFEIAPGSLCVLRGSNGSGKSTLLRCLSGLESLSAGEFSCTEPGPSFLSHSSFLYSCLSVADNLRLYNVKSPKFGVDAFQNKRVETLSAGQTKRVSLAVALSKQSKLLLLDEPFTNLDATSVCELQEHLKVERANGVGVIVSSHGGAELDEDLVVNL